MLTIHSPSPALIPYFVYRVISWQTCGLFPHSLAVMDKAAVNICVHIYLCFISLWLILGGGIDEWYVNSNLTINFLHWWPHCLFSPATWHHCLHPHFRTCFIRSVEARWAPLDMYMHTAFVYSFLSKRRIRASSTVLGQAWLTIPLYLYTAFTPTSQVWTWLPIPAN